MWRPGYISSRFAGGGVKAGRKPGSVRPSKEGGNHLSGIAVTDDLERRTLAERGRWPPVVPWPCSHPGFTEPAPLDAAGALLPHLCNLACAASQSFLSPIGYQTNLMVYALGRNRFLDYFRFCWPLSLAYALIVPLLLLWFV